MASTLALATLVGLVLARSVVAAEPVLRVGTSDDYPPFSLRGRGFDVDAVEAMARDFGMRIEWVRFRWPELRSNARADVFDVAMSGITWRPERAVIGWMSRAVAQGGPCVVGDPTAGLVAVNRGGVLESWARRRFAPQSLVAVDDNLSLPTLLEGGAVSAFVTDSFEAASRPRRTDDAVRCEPPRDRKVYWIAPRRASALGPRIDAWLAANESAPRGAAPSLARRSVATRRGRQPDRPRRAPARADARGRGAGSAPTGSRSRIPSVNRPSWFGPKAPHARSAWSPIRSARSSRSRSRSPRRSSAARARPRPPSISKPSFAPHCRKSATASSRASPSRRPSRLGRFQRIDSSRSPSYSVEKK